MIVSMVQAQGGRYWMIIKDPHCDDNGRFLFTDVDYQQIFLLPLIFEEKVAQISSARLMHISQWEF